MCMCVACNNYHMVDINGSLCYMCVLVLYTHAVMIGPGMEGVS